MVLNVLWGRKRQRSKQLYCVKLKRAKSKLNSAREVPKLILPLILELLFKSAERDEQINSQAKSEEIIRNIFPGQSIF